ncbi:DUF5050 domain-containing protein [Clostridium botulinum]|uniref:DUF5050 domain-containing protein n=1 Tax=Clostridium botulinum TaxID=1491 RepID=UPI00052E3424|nr:DUF5050 domain-containing protein [Clostridium botulinum]KGM93796.1 hypothetical protein Z956_10775 [Clostridium botulinum D str. CCUG 7971]KOC47303.1 hypothetical protein ADU88_10730 [Clostridium botulinum]NFO97467.1 DUF5050 domain-containing protein [Clostridium botulinum]OOV53173.1 DUF5050 domain-containing protein [Clostridium botulinum D/C]OOV57115.1 DUF5050 domain-containing protein [Clostridium botulinum D/C]
MKSKLRTGILSLTILSMFLSIPKITFAANDDIKDSECELRYRKDPVQENKNWKIKFNKELDSSSISSDNVLIQDENGSKIYASVSLDEDDKDKKTVIVKPNSRFKQGKKYSITIKKDGFKAKKDGKKISKPVRMFFYIKNAYAGLPYENGLIVVRDTAYSIDYLAHNSKLKNEILNDSYTIYYCYSPTEQKIKNIFGNIDMTKNDIQKHYDKMTYVGANGEKFFYGWNDEELQYDLIEPAVKTEITVNSSAKVMMVKVKSVEGIDGAVYFKLAHSNDVKRIGETIVFTSQNLREPISILNYNKNIIAKGVLNTQFANEKSTKLTVMRDTNKGNTSGNINNNGYVAENGDGYIFYNNTGDKNNLYKLDANGMFNNAIAYDNVQYTNAIDEWVFYSNYSDRGKLYKIKEDGTGRRKLNDDMSSYVTVSGDWIYYCNHSDGGKIYKIRPDGSGRSKITSSFNHETAYLNVSGDWIYFTDVNDKHRPYIINTDGTYIAKLSDEWADSIQVVGDWVYYTSGTGVLSKVKKDGSGQVIAIKGQAREFDKGFHLNVSGNWIFYSNYIDSGKLYKIRTDGSGDKKKLTNDTVDYINIVGNYIYFTSKGKLFRLPIDTDGNIKPEQISKNNGKHTIIQMDDQKVTVSYSDVNMKIADLEDKYLPKKVPGIMDDNTMHQFSVDWDRKNVSIRNGVRVYTGDVIGYNRKVKLDLIIPSEMINETNTVTIYTNAEKNSDVIEVENEFDNNLTAFPAKLNEGDIVSVYDDEGCRKLLGKANVIRNGVKNVATIQRVDLDKYAQKSAWITVTRKGKVESKPTEIKHSNIPLIGKVEDRDDPSNFNFYDNGLGLGVDGRDFSITDWKAAGNMADSRYDVYIMPSSGRLDVSKDDAEVKATIRAGERWTGDSTIKTDSKKGNLRKGKYSVFVVGKFKGEASCDNRGKKPSVKGKISSNPGVLDVEEETLPRNIEMRTRGSVQRGQDIILNSAPKEGEYVWLIPVNVGKNTLKKDDPSAINRDREIRNSMRKLISQTETWLSQKTDKWPLSFNDANNTYSGDENAKKIIRELGIGCLRGDGVKNTIKAPSGMDPSNPYYVDVEYKLLTVNKVGSNGFSRDRITVDNKAPNMFNEFTETLQIPNKTPEDSFRGKVIDEGNSVETVNDSICVYIVQAGAESNNKEELENAVRQKAGKMIKVSKGVPYTFNLNGLQAITKHDYENYYRPRNLKNYKVLAIDEAGNISNITWFNIIVDTDKLNTLIEKCDHATKDLAALNNEQEQTLKPILDRAKDTLLNAGKKMQRDIDLMANQLEGTMERMGIPVPSYSGYTPTKERIVKAVVNGLYLKQNNTYIKNGSHIESNIQLDTTYKLNSDIHIQWISNDTNTISNDGIVTRGMKNKDVTLKAMITYQGYTEQKSFTLTVTGIDIAAKIVNAEYKAGGIEVNFLKPANFEKVKLYKVLISGDRLSENEITTSTGTAGNVDIGTSSQGSTVKFVSSKDYKGNNITSGNYYIYVVSFNDKDEVMLSQYKTITIR